MGDTPKLLRHRQEEEIAIIRQFGYGGVRERRERDDGALRVKKKRVTNIFEAYGNSKMDTEGIDL